MLCVILQQSLDSVLAWSRHWQLALSESKCAVLHLSVGVNHSGLREYFISDYRLPVIDCFTDLGVTFNNKFNFSSHIDKISHRASLRAKLILRCFSTRNVDILKRAFCTFVRPLLEYASIVWNPNYKKDINKIESVQRRFTKFLPGQYCSSYEQRLNNLGLESLNRRRLTADLVMCYKILHGLLDVDATQFFVRSQNHRTRGNSKRLIKSHCTSSRDSSLFWNRIVTVWNSLPDCIIVSQSVNCFKARLASFDLSRFLV